MNVQTFKRLRRLRGVCQQDAGVPSKQLHSEK